MHVTKSWKNFQFHRNISVAALFLFFVTRMTAQTTIEYTYDAAGNRILRQAVRTTQPNISPQQHEERIVIPILKMSIFPNPTTGPVTIEIEKLSSEDSCTAVVYNIAGTQILSQPIHSTFTCVDLSQYPAGYYILQVTLNGANNSFKIIKEAI